MSEIKIIGNIVNNIIKGIEEGHSLIALQGSARCFAAGTKIRMADGRLKNVEEIRSGDKVMSATGVGYNTVTETHSGTDMMYKICQNRGIDYIVNSQHVLSIIQTEAFTKKIKDENGKVAHQSLPFDNRKIEDMEIAEFMSKNKTYRSKFCGTKNTTVHLPYTNLPIDPYYLGVWLGDGSSNSWHIISNVDKEIREYIDEYAKSLGTTTEDINEYTYRLQVHAGGMRNEKINDKVKDVYEAFKNLNLIGNKHIPDEYIYTAYQNRLRLLAGLLDSDGYNTKRNTIAITQKNKQIAEAIVEICRITGFYTNGICNKTAQMKREDGSIYTCPVYIVEINHNNFNDLNRYMRVKRKRIEGKQCDRNYFHTKISIEECGKGEYYGFTLDKSPYFLLEDGTIVHNSGKTHNIIIFLISCCLNPNIVNNLMAKYYPKALEHWQDAVNRGIIDIEDAEDRKPSKPEVVDKIRVSIVRGSLPVIKRSVYMDDFKPVMMQMGVWNEKNMNKTEMVYTFPNGSTIEFFGTDGPIGEQKSRGPGRDILFCNEANEIEEHNFKQLKMRTRMFTICDFNPSFSEEHWLFKEISAYGTYHFISTFRDNPFLTTAIKEEIFSYKTTNPGLWEIFGLGHFAIVEGLVFPKGTWDVVDETSIPIGVKVEEKIGMDIGFSGKGDPTTAIDCKFANINGIKHVWLKELMYDKGLNEQQVSFRMKPYNHIPKYIDSANPLYIQNLRDNGVQLLYAVKKYNNSVIDGLTKCLGYVIHIIRGNHNLEKEFRNYCWMQDGNGGYTNQPIDKFNHCFSGDTKVLTGFGQKKIKNVRVGELIYTRKGLRPVLKKFKNGVQELWYVEIITSDNKKINLKVTPGHKIKTDKGWKQVRNLKKGERIYLFKSLMEKNTASIRESGTSQEAIRDFMLSCGNITMGLFRKVFMFITWMRIPLITLLTILNCSVSMSIYRFMYKSICANLNILRELADIWPKPANALKIGTVVKMAEDGIVSTLNRKYGKSMSMCVNSVESISLHLKHAMQSFAATTANQNGDGRYIWTMKQGYVRCVANYLQRINTKRQQPVVQSVVESIRVLDRHYEPVYNLMVHEHHEYFANGLLVSNCIDSFRYATMTDRSARGNRKRRYTKGELGVKF